MVGSGFVPNLIMYNAMIGLQCNNSNIDNAFRLLDDMVFHGVFPDSLTYNMIFECLINNRKVREVGNFFNEMIKNECPPTDSNCAEAIRMLFEGDDPEAAIEIWEYMVENNILPLDDCANALLIGLCNLDRPTEWRRFAENMLHRGISVSESTKAELKNASCDGIEVHARGMIICLRSGNIISRFSRQAVSVWATSLRKDEETTLLYTFALHYFGSDFWREIHFVRKTWFALITFGFSKIVKTCDSWKAIIRFQVVSSSKSHD